MTELDWKTNEFERERSRLRAVAYRMLGSTTDAEDAVQEAWLRLSRADSGSVDNLAGWLTTVVARVCIDMLRTRRSRSEHDIETWLPEPVVSVDDQADPENEALIADSVGIALLVVLETLSPPERLAFVLHDMFAMPFDEIAPIIGRSTDGTRQLASRARRRVRGATPQTDPDLREQRRVVDAFLTAATSRRCSTSSTPM
jgi:RNA polymerase sigma-70 factor (ECF subfamily)